MMHERLIYKVLKDGVAEFLASEALTKDFFERSCFLETAEIDKVWGIFQAFPPGVIHGYPRGDTQMPTYCITQDSESEADSFLGEIGTYIDDPDSLFDGYTLQPTLVDKKFSVWVYGENLDLVNYYYHLAKTLLRRGDLIFYAKGITDLSMTGGDLSPDKTYRPSEALFVRRLVINMTANEQVVINKESIVGQIDGVYSDTQVTGVVGHVTAYVDKSE